MRTRDMAPDHRRIAVARRASERTRRRALLIIAAVSPEDAHPDPATIARFDRLVGEADRLHDRIIGLPADELERRDAWRTGAGTVAA